MTTISRQPGEHDFATDLLGGIVLGLTLGLVDLTTDASEPADPSGHAGRPRCITFAEDRERE